MDPPPWSATRARTLQECRRKYYYRYHLAPLVRTPEPPPEAYQADRIKDLLGLEAWTGELVHSVIEAALNRWRARRPFSEQEALAHAGRLLSRQFRDSREFWTEDPEAFPRRPALLDMHYYSGGALSRERAGVLKEMVTVSIRAFLGSDLARRIRAAGPQSWLPIERNAAAHLDGTLVLVKPDFAFVEDGFLHILDWKTGREDPFWERVQVTCYALYAAAKWGRPLDRIVPGIVHLHPSFRFSETEFSEESIRDVRRYIRESQGEMLSLREPQEPPTEERFPLTPDCGRCRWCQFRGICDGARRNQVTRVTLEDRADG